MTPKTSSISYAPNSDSTKWENGFPESIRSQKYLASVPTRFKISKISSSTDYTHFSDYVTELVKLQEAYETAKRQRQLVDYDDLLVKLRAVLRTDEVARHNISQLYRYILVDEYQDTNRLQADLVRNLAATHNNVMVVGR